MTDLFARLLLKFEPETAHAIALRGLGLYGRLPVPTPKTTTVILKGIAFPRRLGLAAGFDKNAQVVAGLANIGFGFIEVGSVTLRPWQGNPRPRIFRFESEAAIVNHMGLPSMGVDYVVGRLKGEHSTVPVLGNVAVTPDREVALEAAAAEYRETAERLGGVVDAVVLNLSCPNTRDGRSFSTVEGARLLARAFAGWSETPLLAKFGPAEPGDVVSEAVEILVSHGFDGIVATNTLPVDNFHGASGGLSGRPLFEHALSRVRMMRRVCGEDALIIGCGGVSGRDDFRRMREAGADLVEVLTAFIFKGAGLIRDICSGLNT